MKTIVIVDEPLTPKAAVSAVRTTLKAAAAELEVGAGALVIRFVTAEEIRRLNREWRGKDQPTDVLSFPAGTVDPLGNKHIGDVAIAWTVAEGQAKKRRHTPAREAALLALHGLLHLLGYDHETDNGEMERLERRLRPILLPPRR